MLKNKTTVQLVSLANNAKPLWIRLGDEQTSLGLDELYYVLWFSSLYWLHYIYVGFPLMSAGWPGQALLWGYMSLRKARTPNINQHMC